jgi:MaoC like domain/short chain dehydrogenase
MSVLEIDSRNFNLEDQKVFATYSGDWNPIHIDPVYARRYPSGNAIVHGIHALLWAMNSWSKKTPKKVGIDKIHVRFVNPINLGDEVVCRVIENDDCRVKLELCVESKKVLLLDFSIEQTNISVAQPIDGTAHPFEVPATLQIGDLHGKTGAWPLDIEYQQTKYLFPELSNVTSLNFIAVLVHTSRLIGMTCPGLNSLYSELELSRTTNEDVRSFKYKVLNTDKRFGLASIETSGGGFLGKAHAFLRKPPINQSDFTEIKKHVSTKAFSGQKVLVIGGSRGLGELTAKYLAAGGADVCLTYFQGESDAKRVVNEIKESCGNAYAFKFDIEKSFEPELIFPDNWRPTGLFYFATPAIFLGDRIGFSSNLLNQFSYFYITAFINIVEKLYKSGLRKAFYPSSVALNELPIDMAEYSIAKVGGELACEILMKRHKDMKIFFPRLPRLETDQTVSLLPVNNLESLPIMSAAINEMMR